MIVSPSLHNQVIQLAKDDDKQVVCICTLAHQPKVLASLLHIDDSKTREKINDLLPFNLTPIATLCLKPDNKGAAAETATRLNLSMTLIFDYKSELWRQEGEEAPLLIGKEDMFLDSIFVGFSTDEPIQRLSSIKLTRKGN